MRKSTVKTEIVIPGTNRVIWTDSKSSDIRKPDPKDQDEIIKKIRSNPVYDAAWSTVETLAGIYGVNVKVIFRNISNAYCQQINVKPTFQIVFGYDAMNYIAENGYHDYKTWDWIVFTRCGSRRPTGTDAAKWIACHEFAHVLEPGRPGAIHTAAWFRKFNELLDLVL